jgi:protein MpaA
VSHRLLLILAALLFPLALQANPFASQVKVTADRLNVRDDVWGNKLGYVLEGQQFNVVQTKEDWGKIEYELGKFGWIALEYTEGLPQQTSAAAVQQFCGELNQEFTKLGWNDARCEAADWDTGWETSQQHPLLYQVASGRKSSESSTLLLCSVHGDESTSYHCFRFAKLLQQQPELLEHPLIIVPMLNPDGFFKKPKQRTNHNEVDLNRNLPTRDWNALAHRQWKWSYAQNPRYFPGKSANSELENQFLVGLILAFTPSKIISLHSPLDFLDLDYMDTADGTKEQLIVRQKAWHQAKKFTAQSGTKFRDYRTFPGSLGRFGDEWKIPVYTLELPSAAAKDAAQEFERVRSAMLKLFNVPLNGQPMNTQPTALNEESSDASLL